MRVHSGSFFLGMAMAGALPLLTRVFRPLAVQLTTAGLGLAEEARRIAAEQAEAVSDIVAEARARRAIPEEAWSGNGTEAPRRRGAARTRRARGERGAAAPLDEAATEKRSA